MRLLTAQHAKPYIMTSKRNILVTSALPYANGPIHLGHLVEYIQTDIWARFQRLRGNSCYYVCADDAHGTPIMLRARQEGITPEELIATTKKEHEADFADFLIDFDNYYSTHSEENKNFASSIYLKLRDEGHIHTRTIKQAYDPEAEMFLPDRFIKGTCPKCGAEDQYGDNCEVCSATYDPTELINPVSAVSGATPVEKDSEQYFFKLSDFYYLPVSITRGGVCGETYLISYTTKGKIIDNLWVEYGCDRPLNEPTDQYSDYKIIEDTIVEIKNYYVQPIDKEEAKSIDYDWTEAEEVETLNIDYYSIIKQTLLP